MAIRKPERGFSIALDHADTMIDFLVSSTERNVFNLPGHGILLKQPELTETGGLILKKGKLIWQIIFCDLGEREFPQPGTETKF